MTVHPISKLQSMILTEYMEQSRNLESDSQEISRLSRKVLFELSDALFF